MSEANREDAAKCIAVARQALSHKDFAKAEKFAAKAQKLYPSDEVRAWQKHEALCMMPAPSDLGPCFAHAQLSQQESNCTCTLDITTPG
eukprot:1160580-Pelagomonas_calceolata.AAC.2